MQTFNLLYSPAFDVRYRGGGVTTLSFRQIMADAKDIDEFVGTPMEQAVAMNTFLGVARDIGVLEPDFSWETCKPEKYDATTFMQDASKDLLGDRLPAFLKMVEFQVKPIGYANWRIPVGMNESIRMMPHTFDNPLPLPLPHLDEHSTETCPNYELCQKCVILGMLYNPLFARKGGQGHGAALAGLNPVYGWEIGECVHDFLKINYFGAEDAAWDISTVRTLAMTTNQACTTTFKLWRVDEWMLPTRPCLLCGDLDAVYRHAKIMHWRGLAIKKGQPKRTTWLPFDKRILVPEMFLDAYKAGEMQPCDENGYTATTHPEKLIAAANRQFATRWKVVGMVADDSKVVGQFLLPLPPGMPPPYFPPKKSKKANGKKFKNGKVNGKSKSCIEDLTFNDHDHFLEQAAFLHPTPDQVDTARKCWRTIVDKASPGELVRIRQATLSQDKLAYYYMTLLCRDYWPRLATKCKECLFPTLAAFACSNQVGTHRPTQVQIHKLIDDPRLGASLYNVDWIYVLSCIMAHFNYQGETNEEA